MKYIDYYKDLILENDNDHYDALKDTGFWGSRGAGCIFLAQNTKKILIALRSENVQEPFTWGGWGGAIDRDESPKTAVKREIKEETGYDGHVELVPLVVFSKTSFKYYNFLAIVKKEFTPVLNWENSSYKWVQYGDWPNPLHFGLSYLIQKSGDDIQKIIANI